MRKLLAGTLLVVALALAVAGCGGGSSPSGSTNSSGSGEASKSAQQVVTDAVKAAEAANSLHMSGQVSAGGQQIGVDLTIVKGKGSVGSLTLKGQKVDLVIVGTNAYMKAGAAFWTRYGGSVGSTIAQLFQGKWLKYPTTNPQFAGFTSIADAKSLFDKLTTSHGTITNKGAAMYAGQSVVDIFDSSKNRTLYIAATGTAYPVAIVGMASGSGGTITFDGWNKPVTLTAPAGAIDVSKLGG